MWAAVVCRRISCSVWSHSNKASRGSHANQKLDKPRPKTAHWPGRHCILWNIFIPTVLFTVSNPHFTGLCRLYFSFVVYRNCGWYPRLSYTPWGRKKEGEPIFFCVHLFSTWQKLVIFFTGLRKVHCVSKKKQDTKLLPITFPNVNRFSKFFHWQTHR